MTQTLEPQTFRKLSKNPRPIEVSRVESLLALEWERFAKSSFASRIEFDLALGSMPLGVPSSFQHWDPYPLSIVSA